MELRANELLPRREPVSEKWGPHSEVLWFVTDALVEGLIETKTYFFNYAKNLQILGNMIHLLVKPFSIQRPKEKLQPCLIYDNFQVENSSS